MSLLLKHAQVAFGSRATSSSVSPLELPATAATTIANGKRAAAPAVAIGITRFAADFCGRPPKADPRVGFGCDIRI